MNTVELQVGEQPIVLYRCGECDSSYWMRDGRQVPVDEVTAALRNEAESTAAAQAARRAKNEATGRTG